VLYVILVLACLGLIGGLLFFVFRSGELASQLRAASEEWRLKEESYTSELAKLEKLRHIPGIIEKARRSNADVEAKLAEAARRAEEIVQRAVLEAQERGRNMQAEADEQCGNLRTEADKLNSQAKEALRVASWQAMVAVDEAEKEAKDLASKARKDAKEKRDKSESALIQATNYALEIRQKAERRAEEIAAEAYEAKGKLRDYEAAALAFKNSVEKYEGVYIIPPTHILDELADEFGFNIAGTRLKLARDRTKLMRASGEAATCGYPDGWKKASWPTSDGRRVKSATP
jgi:hypothetical protein